MNTPITIHGVAGNTLKISIIILGYNIKIK